MSGPQEAERDVPEIVKWIQDGIRSFGISTVLLIVFLLMYMGFLPSGVSMEVSKLHTEHTEIIDKNNKSFNELARLISERDLVQLRLLRQICRNTAKTEGHAIECDR